MTVSMRVMSAGDGYKYLIRTVAAGDGDRALSTPLTRYYAEAGTPPGFWIGAGVSALGDGSLYAGSCVSEAQLHLLIGMGRDPLTGEPLGRAYQTFATVGERIAKRTELLGPELGAAARGHEAALIEAEETARGTRRAVAGFDYTFSAPKSVSVLWAVADAGTQSLIVEAHHAAIADLVAFLEREVAATRVGATGPDGAVAHVDVVGVAATAFDHYDSRAGDPQLHTHVVISNKVLTAQDGKWRTLAGRPMHSAVVALSELYNAVLADRLTRTLGVDWEKRERGRDRNPAWEIASVPDTLISEFSSRARHIAEEKDRLIAEYVVAHGRQPSARTILKLRAQATLATRRQKEIHSLAELTARWRRRATAVLAEDANAWAVSATAGEPGMTLRADDISLDAIDDLGCWVMTAVGEKRSTWQRWNLHAEASRQIMGLRFASTRDREAITGMIVDAAERASLRLTPPELSPSPVQFRFPDGNTRLRPRHATVFSSEQLFAAEDRLLQRADTMAAPTLQLEVIEKHARQETSDGQILSADQSAALAAIVISGRTIDVLVGPAGAGKTMAMLALRRAWEAEHGAASVIGLAPSAAAAQALSDDLGIPTENTAKWWHAHTTTGASFAAGQLVIIDEASLAGTRSLDQITDAAAAAGAKTLLVGDYAQLQSVDAGGAFTMLVHARADAPELTDIHRFTHAWEKLMSLDLRHGHTRAIDALTEHDRVRGGEEKEMVDAAYNAWRDDTSSGRVSILVAETHEIVTALNERARADLTRTGRIHGDRDVILHDGTAAASGDVIITRKNDRRLSSGNGHRWVRNGDRWIVTRVREDGSISIRPEGGRFGNGIVLPAAYVAEFVDLGYAVTAHRAQGITTDTAHTVVTATTTRENFYVAMTRGRDANHAYVATDRPEDMHAMPHPSDDPRATARSVLNGVLRHVGAEPSAHEALRREQERLESVAQLAAEYETIAQTAQHDRWIQLLSASGLTRDQVDDILASDAYGALSAELRRAEANHYNLETLLPRLIAARGFGDADDVASVIHERVARATARSAATGRASKTPLLIAGLIPFARGAMTTEMQEALNERHRLIRERAEAVLNDAIAAKAPWVRSLGDPPPREVSVRAWVQSAQTIATYRDRYLIDTDDPLGPPAASAAQKIDAVRARAALDLARRLAAEPASTETALTPGLAPARHPQSL